MNDEASFDVIRAVIGVVVVVGGLFALPHILPLVTSAVLSLVPLVLIVWLVVTVLKGIVSKLMP